MRRLKFLLGACLGTAAMLCSCGDEVTSLEYVQSDPVQNVAAGDSLPSCDSLNLGEIIFVQDSNALMFCFENSWTHFKGTDTVYVSHTDTVEVYVRDTVVKKDSIWGVPGTGCNAELIKGGHKIVCGLDSVGVILDGIEGADGRDGADGVGSCETTDDGNGIIKVSCGDGENAQIALLYKALCDNVPYDPDNKICIDHGLLPVCQKQNVGFVEVNTNGVKYTCRDSLWAVSSDKEINMGKACLSMNLGEMLEGADGEKWVCRDEWELATEMEIAMGKSCTESNQSESLLLEYSYWVCRADSIGWVYDFEHLNRDSVEYAGRVYKTVGIGSQMWFAENLNYADSVSTPNLKGNWWCYNNQESKCETTGRLYSWTAAMDISSEYQTKSASEAGVISAANHRGICPEGWHIPTHAEYVSLHDFVDANNGNEGVGTSLKAATGWISGAGVAVGTDRFGFNMEAGNKWVAEYSKFNPTDGDYTDLWINPVTDVNPVNRITTWVLSVPEKGLDNNDFWPHYNYHLKASGMSVRCLKD